MVDTSSPALYIKTAIVGALIVTLYMYRRQQTRRNQLAAHRAAVQAATLWQDRPAVVLVLRRPG